MKRAAGLGKRKAEAEPEVGAEPEAEAQIYFPVEEDQDEIQQAAVMLAHAELSLDEPEKCIPLLRAVVHECDRIGRLKEMLEEGVEIANVEEEQIAALGKLELTDEFFRVFGDALFRLACVEGDGDGVLATGGMFMAAIERYDLGLALFPASALLKHSRLRARVILSVMDEPSSWQDAADEWLEAIENGKDTSQLLAATEVLEQISPHVDDPRVYATRLAALCCGSTDVALNMARLKALNHLIDYEFEADNLDACKDLVKQAEETVEGIDVPALQQDDAESHRPLLSLLAQLHLWKGCLADADADDDDSEGNEEANARYNDAVLLWREIARLYDEPIPEHILALETPAKG